MLPYKNFVEQGGRGEISGRLRPQELLDTWRHLDPNSPAV